MLDGYQPGDPVVRVFAYQASPGRAAEEIAEEAFAIFNDHPADAAGAERPALPIYGRQAAVIAVFFFFSPGPGGALACAYYGRRLRSLSVGDVVAVVADGEVRLAVAKIGWTPVPGPLTEVRTSEHGTRPLRRGGTARRRQDRLDPGPRPADRGPHQRARHPPAPAARLRAGQRRRQGGPR